MGNSVNSKQRLETVNDDEIKFFSFEGQTLNAKVSNVYDADTIHVIIEILDNRFYKFKVRLNRIDSPEIKPLKTCNYRDLNINCAKKCKLILSDIILGKIVEVKCNEYDKYGRILADVYYKGVNINDLLIDNKLVKSYLGNKKTEWTIDELNHIDSFNYEQFKNNNVNLFK